MKNDNTALEMEPTYKIAVNSYFQKEKIALKTNLSKQIEYVFLWKTRGVGCEK